MKPHEPHVTQFSLVVLKLLCLATVHRTKTVARRSTFLMHYVQFAYSYYLQTVRRWNLQKTTKNNSRKTVFLEQFNSCLIVTWRSGHPITVTPAAIKWIKGSPKHSTSYGGSLRCWHISIVRCLVWWASFHRQWLQLIGLPLVKLWRRQEDGCSE